MMTRQMQHEMHPRSRRRRRTLIAVLAVPVLVVVLVIGYFVLVWNNIAFLDGPSRREVTHSAEDLLAKATATVTPPLTVGTPDPSFTPCGRLDGLGQVQYFGGIKVAFSGADPSEHKRIEDQLTTRGMALARNLKGRWVVAVSWDSPTSTTGSIDIFLSCTDIAN